jgi:universal stress protein A
MANDKVFSRILCPIDFNHELGALELALRLAHQNEARIDLLSVAEIPMGATEVNAGFNDQGYPYWEVGLRELMDKLVKERFEGREDYTAKVLSGEAAAWIVRYAREQQSDLIVMATHGRSGLSHLLMGSVTEAVIRSAHCPVLTYRPQ